MLTADLLTIKLLINSIISTQGAKFMTMDIKDFNLNTPMVRYKYMQLKILDMPDDVIEHYKLCNIVTPDGHIFCEIQKGMYGLPQAGIIVQELLADRLRQHGYMQSKTTPGLWSHETCPIQFSLIVDDFGIKYVGKENALHLLNTIQKYKKCSCDWDGEQYCGPTIKWDYEGRKVHLLMPTYIKKALQRFQHPPPYKTAKPTAPQRQEDLWGKSAVHKTTQQSPTARQSGEEIYPRSHGSVFILGPSS
jgi:hypothetical protein